MIDLRDLPYYLKDVKFTDDENMPWQITATWSRSSDFVTTFHRGKTFERMINEEFEAMDRVIRREIERHLPPDGIAQQAYKTWNETMRWRDHEAEAGSVVIEFTIEYAAIFDADYVEYRDTLQAFNDSVDDDAWHIAIEDYWNWYCRTG